MKTKMFLILAIALAFTGLTLLFLLTATKRVSPPFRLLPTPTPVRVPLKKITISGIKMNDFLSSLLKINENGDALFVKTEGYQLVYLKPYNKFLITILSSPFEENRKKGEENFLKKLGITEEEACKLNVSISTPYFANPDYSGVSYPLSFCKNRS